MTVSCRMDATVEDVWDALRQAERINNQLQKDCVEKVHGRIAADLVMQSLGLWRLKDRKDRCLYKILNRLFRLRDPQYGLAQAREEVERVHSGMNGTIEDALRWVSAPTYFLSLSDGERKCLEPDIKTQARKFGPKIAEHEEFQLKLRERIARRLKTQGSVSSQEIFDQCAHCWITEVSGKFVPQIDHMESRWERFEFLRAALAQWYPMLEEPLMSLRDLLTDGVLSLTARQRIGSMGLSVSEQKLFMTVFLDKFGFILPAGKAPSETNSSVLLERRLKNAIKPFFDMGYFVEPCEASSYQMFLRVFHPYPRPVEEGFFREEASHALWIQPRDGHFEICWVYPGLPFGKGLGRAFTAAALLLQKDFWRGQRKFVIQDTNIKLCRSFSKLPGFRIFYWANTFWFVAAFLWLIGRRDLLKYNVTGHVPKVSEEFKSWLYERNQKNRSASRETRSTNAAVLSVRKGSQADFDELSRQGRVFGESLKAHGRTLRNDHGKSVSSAENFDLTRSFIIDADGYTMYNFAGKASGSLHVALWQRQGEIVSYGWYAFPERATAMFSFHVFPAYRGQGVAREALMDILSVTADFEGRDVKRWAHRAVMSLKGSVQHDARRNLLPFLLKKGFRPLENVASERDIQGIIKGEIIDLKVMSAVLYQHLVLERQQLPCVLKQVRAKTNASVLAKNEFADEWGHQAKLILGRVGDESYFWKRTIDAFIAWLKVVLRVTDRSDRAVVQERERAEEVRTVVPSEAARPARVGSVVHVSSSHEQDPNLPVWRKYFEGKLSVAGADLMGKTAENYAEEFAARMNDAQDGAWQSFRASLEKNPGVYDPAWSKVLAKARALQAETRNDPEEPVKVKMSLDTASIIFETAGTQAPLLPLKPQPEPVNHSPAVPVIPASAFAALLAVRPKVKDGGSRGRPYSLAAFAESLQGLWKKARRVIISYGDLFGKRYVREIALRSSSRNFASTGLSDPSAGPAGRTNASVLKDPEKHEKRGSFRNKRRFISAVLAVLGVASVLFIEQTALAGPESLAPGSILGKVLEGWKQFHGTDVAVSILITVLVWAFYRSVIAFRSMRARLGEPALFSGWPGVARVIIAKFIKRIAYPYSKSAKCASAATFRSFARSSRRKEVREALMRASALLRESQRSLLVKHNQMRNGVFLLFPGHIPAAVRVKGEIVWSPWCPSKEALAAHLTGAMGISQEEAQLTVDLVEICLSKDEDVWPHWQAARRYFKSIRSKVQQETWRLIGRSSERQLKSYRKFVEDFVLLRLEPAGGEQSPLLFSRFRERLVQFFGERPETAYIAGFDGELIEWLYSVYDGEDDETAFVQEVVRLMDVANNVRHAMSNHVEEALRNAGIGALKPTAVVFAFDPHSGT
ncbi:MAG TPA: hypothetical protein P5246_02245, partial [Candidatus Omnitrophota bacterium]|nr:hypothetical protein [Candidatus Omnitrophota bacterium]